LQFCTIASVRRLAQARVLAESLAAHHPNAPLHVLLVDDRDREIGSDSASFHLLRPSDLSIGPGEFEDLAILCEPEELWDALIPRLLLHLVRTRPDPVVYLGDSQWVLAPLSPVEEALAEADCVLVPRLRTPLPPDERTPSEAQALERGLITTTVVGARGGAKEFLSWWAERTAEEARGEAVPDRWLGPMEHRALRTALKRVPRIPWLDLATHAFRLPLVADPGVAVSFWNLDGRTVTKAENGWRVGDRLLRSFDFEGYSVEKPYLLSSNQGSRPRVVLSEHPDLRSLAEEYASHLRAHDIDSWGARPDGYSMLTPEVPIDARMRRLYREAIRYDVLDRALPPNPFVEGNLEAFLKWLNQPVFGDLSRYLTAVHAERQDLQVVFADPAEPLFLTWVRDHGREEEQIPDALLPPPAARETEPRRDLPEGVNLIGFLSAQAGLGVSSRALLQALDRAGVPTKQVPLAHPFANERGVPSDTDAPYDVNIVCGTPDLIIAVGRDLGSDILQDRYNIGLFFWESDQFRPHSARAFRLTDEVWASSWYIADAVRSVFDGPIRIYPHPFTPPDIPSGLSRADLGLPDGFLFLFVFDYSSSFKRKNPVGLVRAFKRAFRPGEGPVLAIKSLVGEHRLAEREQLWGETVDRPDIVLLEGTWPEERKNALMAVADCYVSLHRSEGLGMTMAEAMLLGKPVIATAFSGNVDFMDQYNSFPVQHGMTEVGPDAEPYDPRWLWADPDIRQAATLMRWVYENPDEARKRGTRAREELLRRRSTSVTATFVKERLAEIREERSGAPEPPAGTVEATAPPPVSDADHRAKELIERGPSLTASRFGAVGRIVRRAVGFLLRPYDRHQREVQRAILDAIREARDKSL
jgi:glycosyltransferase involved in cell wall biosynthesis